jgi:hypothetical protein
VAGRLTTNSPLAASTVATLTLGTKLCRYWVLADAASSRA